MKYYDFHRMYHDVHPDYGFILGGRGNGKSFATARQWIDNYHKDGSQFARFIRYFFDMQSNFVSNYFDPALCEWLKKQYNEEIWYESGEYKINKIGASSKEADTIGYVLALSNEQKYKSNQYPRVLTIDVEEFALLDPQGYLRDEVERFLSLLSTVVRHRKNVTVYFVGNTIGKYNPYFDFLHVNIDKLKLKPGDLKMVPQPQGEYDETPVVAIEYAQMSYETMKEIPRLFKVSGNDTATTGAFITPPDVIQKENVKFEQRRVSYIVEIGGVKFKMNIFACFVYWEQCKGEEKNLRPNMLVKSMCYDKTRYFWNAIAVINKSNRIPTEHYYDTEETKHYVQTNILNDWRSNFIKTA